MEPVGQMAMSGNSEGKIGLSGESGVTSPFRKRPRMTPAKVLKRDRERDLRDFLLQVNNYAPTLPVEVTRFHLERAGAQAKKDQLVKLVSLAADRLAATIILDCSRYRDLRLKGGDSRVHMEDTTEQVTLTKADLALSLEERGITLFSSELLVSQAGPGAVVMDGNGDAA